MSVAGTVRAPQGISGKRGRWHLSHRLSREPNEKTVWVAAVRVASRGAKEIPSRGGNVAIPDPAMSVVTPGDARHLNPFPLPRALLPPPLWR